MLPETFFIISDRCHLRMKEWKKISQEPKSKQPYKLASPISDKVEFKLIQRDEEDHFIHIKGKINEKDIIILNVNSSNTSASTITASCKITD